MRERGKHRGGGAGVERNSDLQQGGCHCGSEIMLLLLLLLSLCGCVTTRGEGDAGAWRRLERSDNSAAHSLPSSACLGRGDDDDAPLVE